MSDRADLQTIINTARPYDHINLDPGRVYVLDGGLVIPPTLNNAWIHMHGAKIVMGDNAPTSINSITVQGPAFSIEGGSFDGGNQIPDPGHHRHAIFVRSPGFVGIDLMSCNQDGDSFYVFSGANNFNLLRCTAQDNLRNGLTFGATADNILISESQFLGCLAQPVDTEPGKGAIVSGLVLHRCLIDPSGKLRAPGINEDYSLTLGGSSADILNADGTITGMEGHDIAIVECEIRGAINIVWGKKIVLDRVTFLNKGSKSCIRSWRNVSQLDILGCNIITDKSPVGIEITGTGATSMPDNIRIEGTNIYCGADNAMGIQLNAVSCARISNCILKGNGASTSVTGVGVYIRSTIPAVPMNRVEVYDTRIESFGGKALVIAGNTIIQPDGTKQTAHINDVRLERLSVGNGPSMTCQSTGLVLDDGTNIVNKLIIGDIQYDSTVIIKETHAGPSIIRL